MSEISEFSYILYMLQNLFQDKILVFKVVLIILTIFLIITFIAFSNLKSMVRI